MLPFNFPWCSWAHVRWQRTRSSNLLYLDHYSTAPPFLIFSLKWKKGLIFQKRVLFISSVILITLPWSHFSSSTHFFKWGKMLKLCNLSTEHNVPPAWQWKMRSWELSSVESHVLWVININAAETFQSDFPWHNVMVSNANSASNL